MDNKKWRETFSADKSMKFGAFFYFLRKKLSAR